MSPESSQSTFSQVIKESMAGGQRALRLVSCRILNREPQWPLNKEMAQEWLRKAYLHQKVDEHCNLQTALILWEAGIAVKTRKRIQFVVTSSNGEDIQPKKGPNHTLRRHRLHSERALG